MRTSTLEHVLSDYPIFPGRNFSLVWCFCPRVSFSGHGTGATPEKARRTTNSLGLRGVNPIFTVQKLLDAALPVPNCVVVAHLGPNKPYHRIARERFSQGGQSVQQAVYDENDNGSKNKNDHTTCFSSNSGKFGDVSNKLGFPRGPPYEKHTERGRRWTCKQIERYAHAPFSVDFAWPSVQPYGR